MIDVFCVLLYAIDNLSKTEQCRPEVEEVSTMNNESSSKQEAPSIPNATVAAAQTVLARRSNEQIPLSLGKASLRIRLEAYYSLISPDTLSNRTVWLRKYDQIYEKVRERARERERDFVCVCTIYGRRTNSLGSTSMCFSVLESHDVN